MNSPPIDDSTYDREIILHRLEALLPLHTKWIKLGLANLMTLMTLIYLETREAFIVTLLRVMLGSILAETSLAPIFFQLGRWASWHRNHVWDLQ
jgi:uncharacterized membrane protein